MENKKLYDAYGNEIVVNADDFKLVQSDKKITDTKFETKTTTFLKDAFRRFYKNKSSVVGAIIISILILLALIVPVISPYNVDNVHIDEKLLGPKLFEPEEGSWDDKWNGTILLKNQPVDEEGFPVSESEKFRRDCVLTYTVYSSQFVNIASSQSVGGTYIFGYPSKPSGTRYLELFDEHDFTSDGGYKVNFTLLSIDFSNEDKLARYDKNATYKVVLEYGPLKKPTERENKKELLLLDWTDEVGDIEINISEKIASAGLESVKDGRIRFYMQEDEGGATPYMAFEKLDVTTTLTDPLIIEKTEVMSLGDASKKILINKQNDGTFPKGYYRTNADKNVYHASILKCDYLYDKYKEVYGIQNTKNVTKKDMENYVALGYCEYDYEVGPSSYKKLNDLCPVEAVVNQTKIVQGDIVTYQLETKVNKAVLLGYSEPPKYLLGTTDNGFDIIKLSFKGLRTSLVMSICVSAICLTFGLCWGSISGYFGGTVDLLMERFCEILSGVPWIVVMTLTILLFQNEYGSNGSTIIPFGIAVCLTGWMGTSATTRTQFYRFKRREYILASRTLGASDMRLIFKHILPNGIGTIITGSVLKIPGVIFSEATLAYLGLLKINNTFGVVLSENQRFLNSMPALVVLPSIIISLLMISFNLFGNGLRDAFNPSLKGSE